MVVMIDAHTFARVQARAFNAHDVDLMVHQALPSARVLRDGELLGEGPDALRDSIEAEYRSADMAHARVIDVDGEPVLAEFTGDENNEAVHGVIRFKSLMGRLEEIHIEHHEAARASVSR